MKDKVILTDCDGVMLDWEYGMREFMVRHGYTIHVDDSYDICETFGISKDEATRMVRIFNESAMMRKLPPLRDSIHYMRKLHNEHGYIFHAITSMSTDTYAQRLRVKNLTELFGDTVFTRYEFLDTGADKDEALKPYADTGCWWIEDKPKNAQLGSDLGLNTLLMHHDHNRNFEYKGVRRVRCWKDIYAIITSESKPW